MSKTEVVTKLVKPFVCAYDQTQIATIVNAVALPVALQGVPEWAGSKEVGGNVASHLAALNGKGQTIALCQLYSDFWFGADSRKNILSGIENKMRRAAFDEATKDVLRVRRPIAASEMLEFLRAYTSAALCMTPAKAKPAIPDSNKGEGKDNDANKGEKQEVRQHDDQGRATAHSLAFGYEEHVNAILAHDVGSMAKEDIDAAAQRAIIRKGDEERIEMLRTRDPEIASMFNALASNDSNKAEQLLREMARSMGFDLRKRKTA